ncbi:transposase, IS605 OrfB family, central region [Rhodococcus jostii]|uniref:Transposase, IS605 OrfB family, central region n=1 Tax=Rhodococcus jostii TaxID=132919 RepID=A0A1H5BYL5_RHOJO|nr:transposase, IS605 OrfB family, central region [Rhodococcus jostii]
MKRIVVVKLVPRPDQFAALEATLALCNEVANEVAGVAQSMGLRSRRALQVALYPRVKTRGLSAQPALHVLRKVADAYTTRQGNLTNGNYGRPGSTRYTAVADAAVKFRPHAAQPFDDRCLSWQMDSSTVSIWTTAGRMRGVRFVCAPWQHELLAARKGETDLVYRDGLFYLYATVDEASPEPAPPPDSAAGWLGVDLGIVNLAVTTDDDPATLDVRWSAGAVTARRKKNAALRATLQKVGTKSAKRKLKTRRRKEQRFATDVNHQLSKSIVAKAQRTGRGIAMEDLSGIRDRVRLARGQRTQLHSWDTPSYAPRSPTRPRWLGCPSLSLTPGILRERAHSAGTATRRTGSRKQHSDADTASGPVIPTTTRPATSPHSDIARTGPPNQPCP